MYSGIIQDQLPVVSINKDEGLLRFSLMLPDELMDGLVTGASVAVNGVCLTVTSLVDRQVSFDAIAETLALSNLDSLEVGSMVNVERSLRHDAEIGGHVLSGHILGTSVVQTIRNSPNNCRMTFGQGPDGAPWLDYLFTKGFIAVNGASLTIAELDLEAGEFAVNLIPETLSRTNFSLLAEGDQVNIEVDSQTRTIVDTVHRIMADRQASG